MSERTHLQPPRVMARDEMQRLLKKCSSGRLGLAFQNESYIVPVSYRYDQGRILFHSARQGKKVDFIKRNNRVCFQVDEDKRHEGWGSVICYGTATLRDDIEARKEFLRAIRGEELSDEQAVEWGTYIGIMQIEDMTGKCSPNFSF